MRLYLEYRDGSVQVPHGETVIGRNVGCSLRFNDPFVSRRHVRILFDDEGLFVEELSSRNGTWVNGRPLEGRQPLADGDELQLGKRTLKVNLVPEDELDQSQETTKPDFPELAESLLDIDDAMAALTAHATEPAPPPEQTCPRCRTIGPASDARCARCGFSFRPGRPASLTQQLPIDDLEEELSEHDRRGSLRRSLTVPVVYTSATMTIDAMTYDLSRNGVFIASPLLDEVGTPCQVTLLPEAAPAIPIRSVVARVTAEGEPGMGVRFEEPSERAWRWLEAVLERGDHS